MPNLLRRLLSFSGIIWMASIGFALYMTLSPLVENVWTAKHWKVTPCRMDSKGYEYAIEGRRYHTDRKDFWQRRVSRDRGMEGTVLNPDAQCYVNPQDPFDAVLDVNANNLLDHWDRLMVSGFVLVVAFGLTHWKPKRK